MSPTTTDSARTIAHRYQAALGMFPRREPAEEIIPSDGVITSDDLRGLLEQRLGPVGAIRFKGPVAGREGAIQWEAQLRDDGTARGRLLPYVVLYDDRVAIWADLIIDDDGSTIRFGTTRPKQLLDERLGRIADMARRLITRVRTQPQTPAHEVIGDIVRLVEVAEGE